MIASFFPNPRVFFPSAVLWALFCILFWYMFARDWGPHLSLGNLVGLPYPVAPVAGGSGDAESEFTIIQNVAADIYLYEYMIVGGALFTAYWYRQGPRQWFWWAVVVSQVIVFIDWFQVQLDVLLNDWFGSFYDLIQKALGAPNTVGAGDYYGQLTTFLTIAMISIMVAVGNAFLVSHYIFRWRMAMNAYYVRHWEQLRKVEGASQRVQEDTMRFASTVEDLGISLIDSVLTLIAFLPLLWGLSSFVTALPFFGHVPQALVFVAIFWSAFGTALLAAAGVRLPGLNFRNQRVEAAYRKELVLGEDDAERAQPPTLAMLFDAVRRNYFYIYLNYLYFNIARYGYLQAGTLVPYIALAPTILAAGFTLGVMQQILRAFDRVTSSFQYLANSWSTIVELISIYKRLHAFESTLDAKPLAPIEHEPTTEAG